MAKTTKTTASKAADSAVESAPLKTGGAKKAPGKTAGAKKGAGKKSAEEQTKTAAAKKGNGAMAAAGAATKTVRKNAAAHQITADERHRLIAEAAYLRSEAQGFLNDKHEDWLAAEAEVDERLSRARVDVIG